jgi:hypothetical protein
MRASNDPVGCRKGPNNVLAYRVFERCLTFAFVHVNGLGNLSWEP